jgi:hypothetical protein
LMCGLERRQYAWRGKRLRASCLHLKLIISTARYAVQYVWFLLPERIYQLSFRSRDVFHRI